MRSTYVRLLATALLLAACGQEDDAGDFDAGLIDASQPVVAVDTGAPPFAADTGVMTGVFGDAGMMNAPRDAGVSADAATDAAAPVGDGGAYSPCPSTGPCKILPLGDSITYGIGYAGSYRVELFRKARAAMKSITFVGSASLANGPTMVGSDMFPRANEGHSGWTIDEVAGLVPKPALDGMPHIVLLMVGTNDLNLNRDLPNAPKRLGTLIDKLTGAAPNALIVVAKITPMKNSGGAGSPVATFNDALPAVIMARANTGKHVVLVDMNTGFPTAGFSDSVHPNQQGYDWMAGVWYQAIGSLLH